jgi:hypothetical protein
VNYRRDKKLGRVSQEEQASTDAAISEFNKKLNKIKRISGVARSVVKHG